MSAAHEFQHRYYDMLMASQYWPVAVLADYQRTQLEQLLRHARATTPFYAQRLDPIFASDGSIRWDSWGDLPIVRRTDLAAHGSFMRSSAPPPGHGYVGYSMSSGSTGQPITIDVNELSGWMTTTLHWRMQTWHGVDWAKDVLFRRNGSVPDGGEIGPWGPRWDERAKRGRSFRLAFETTPEGTVQMLDRLKPTYHSNGPKIMQVLQKEARRLGLEIRLEAVFAFGEAVSEADRRAARDGFGAKIIEMYSSKEGGPMAHACPGGGGLHINAEAVLLEIIGDHGRPCAPGETGHVVITPFVSSAQPLIRYDVGDLAVAGGICTCGRSLPMIREIAGRTTAIFTHPDGRMNVRMLPHELRDELRAGPWQIAQIGPQSFEVRYVPLDPLSLGDEAGFAAKVREIYFGDSEVKIRRVEEIRPTAAGKYIEYINEWAKN